MIWSRVMAAPSLTGAALVLCLVAFGCQEMANEDTEGEQVISTFHPDTVPMPASMLRRLAAVADGISGTAERWVVADPAFPHRLSGSLFASEAAAEAYRDSVAPGFGVFGPLTRSAQVGTVGRPSLILFMNCKTPWTRYECDDQPDRDFFDAAEVDSINIVFYGGGEPLKSRSFGADSLDAVFFNLRAYDRFAVPYNVRVYGIDHAMAMRDSLLEVADTALAQGG